MEFEHEYVENLKSELKEVESLILGSANYWIEWHYKELEAIKRKESEFYLYLEDDEDIEEALNEHKESPISVYENGYEFKDIDEAIRLLGEIGDTEVDTEKYEKLSRQLEEALDKLERVKEEIEMIEKYLEIKSISTSRKSISTYLYFEMNEDNYVTLINDICLDDNDYYDEIMEGYDTIDEFTDDYSHHDLCIRISDHEVGSRYDFFYGDISYSDESAKIYI